MCSNHTKPVGQIKESTRFVAVCCSIVLFLKYNITPLVKQFKDNFECIDCIRYNLNRLDVSSAEWTKYTRSVVVTSRDKGLNIEYDTYY